MKTILRLLLAASILLALFGAPAHSATLSLRPTDDAEAASDKPSSNYGYNGTLRVDTKRVAYLRFDLSALSGATVESATLRLYAVNSGSGTQTVRQMVEVPWTEGTLTWRNRPTSVKATVGSFGRTAQNTWVSVNSKSATTGAAGGKLTLSILGNSKSTLYLSSGEATSNQPELVVVYSKPTEPPPAVSSGVGINLATPADWATEFPFIDLMKLSDGWHTQCDKWSGSDPTCTHPNSDWDTQEQDLLDLDVNGWPRSLPAPSDPVYFTRVATLVPAGLSPAHPSDRLVVKYPGSGEVQYKFDGCSGAVTRGFDPADPTVHRDVLDVQGNSGSEAASRIHVVIAATDSNNPIRNIQVTPAGGVCSNDPIKQCDPVVTPSSCANQARCDRFEDVAVSRPFHPRFLANTKPFAQIRTMEFQNINDSLLSVWSNRSLPAHKQWTARDNSDGVPVEVITQLANTLGVDLWLNVPSRASDDLVVQMASLVKSSLDPQRHLTLEYSNEAWNTAFGTNGNWIEAQGVAAWPDASDHPYLKRLNWYGKRAGEVCKLWKTAWGSADSSRVTCVAGGQSASRDFTSIMLDCPLNDHPCYEDIDSLAIAPYFGYYLGSPANAPVVASWSNDLNTLFNELTAGGTPGLSDAPAGGALNQAIAELNSQVALARDRGLSLCGYEAGQHLVGFAGAENNATLTDRFTSANRDLRMGQIYLSYLQKWQESGAGPVMLFNSAGSYGKWGSWGLLEYRDQALSSSAKYKAVVQDFLGQSLP